ncbi:MAG: DNA-binding response regulator [Zetaproteobacteria bacterium]|nr:MAG: DNA-binding response regulator [Zetaproteobacteria bacterium]
MHAISTLARDLMRLARTTPITRFQDEALARLRELVSFDSALWATGTMQDEVPHTHDMHLFNLPTAMIAHYRHIQPQDVLLARLIATRRKQPTWNIYDIVTREQFEQSAFYRDYCRIYGLEQLQSTSHYDEAISLYSIISLYRRDPAHNFSTRDRHLQEMLVPLLVDARNLNLFIGLQKRDMPMHHAIAICDRRSLVMEAEPGFAPLMRRQWPDWRGPFLPLDASAMLNRETPEFFSQLVLWAKPHGQLLQVHARRPDQFDRLTPTQQRIVRLVAAGESNKLIADRLALSPKTVSNHLYNIFRRLGIHNRHQLTELYRKNRGGQSQ